MDYDSIALPLSYAGDCVVFKPYVIDEKIVCNDAMASVKGIDKTVTVQSRGSTGVPPVNSPLGNAAGGTPALRIRTERLHKT